MDLALIATLVVVALIVIVAATAGRAYWRARGTRVITCPENQQSAAVEIDGARAAVSALRGKADIRLRDCSRWPEREGCGQMCLEQIESAPDGCLIRSTLEAWYAGKSCALCGQPFGPIHWHDHRPGLLTPDRKTEAWDAFPAETIPEVLRTHRPVCWNCLIAETFRRRHPDRFIDRGPAS